jgi:hypothetical protein
VRVLPSEGRQRRVAARALRWIAALLRRAADLHHRPGSRRLPLEPVKVAGNVDERMCERRHQLFVRYY